MNFKQWNRGRVLNVKKIIAVKNATYAVAKEFLKKFKLAGNPKPWPLRYRRSALTNCLMKLRLNPKLSPLHGERPAKISAFGRRLRETAEYQRVELWLWEMIWYFDRVYQKSRYISHYFIHLSTKEEFMVFSSSFWRDNISGRAIDSESVSLKDLSKDQHSLSLSLIYIDNFHHDIQVKPYLVKRK